MARASVAPEGSGRFQAGDGIRAVAALSVVVFHVAYFAARGTASYATAYGSVPGALLAHLDLGLYLFFVLSGYLIARPFLAAFVFDRPLPSISDYAIARILRIVPAFWVVFTLLMIRNGSLGTGPFGVASVYAFAQNYHATAASLLVGPAWTLDIEVIFYALVPLGALAAAAGVAVAGRRLAPPMRVRVALFAIVGVTGASLVARAALPQTVQWQISAPAMLFAFMPGVACAALEQSAPEWLRARPVAAGWLCRGLLALALLVAIVYITGPGTGAVPARVGVSPVLAAASAGLVLAAALVREWAGSSAWRVFGDPRMRWIGERSYGLYLVHQGLLFDILRWHVGLGHPRERFLALLPVTLAAGLLAAALLFALVERPAMSLRRRLVAPRRLGVGGRAA